MREATFWDLLNSLHYSIIAALLIAIVLESIFLLFAINRGSKSRILAATGAILATLFVGFFLRRALFPGGALYDTNYQFSQAKFHFIQDQLRIYHEICGRFPSTTPGLEALKGQPPHNDCAKYEGQYIDIREMRYTSGGTRYEIESTADFKIPGLFIRGTDALTARLYIRE